MAKSPGITQFLDAFSKSAFGVPRTEALKSHTCVACHGWVGDFRDELSRKEYSISGLCQSCQDATFGVVDGE